MHVRNMREFKIFDETQSDSFLRSLRNEHKESPKKTRLEHLFNFKYAQGKLSEALNAYQQDLAISKRLAERDETKASRQRGLWNRVFRARTCQT